VSGFCHFLRQKLSTILSTYIVQLDCREKQARMVIETEGGRQVFLIEDPGRIVITAVLTVPFH
jgi:hypothetical protein